MQKIFLAIAIALVACDATPDKKAQAIVDSAIRAHGQQHLVGSKVSFSFREKDYASSRTSEGYVYSRSYIDSLDIVEDILVNGNILYHLINDDTTKIDEKEATIIKNGLNSVLYFTQLPYLLNDEAVIKTYQGSTIIEGLDYHAIKVQFKTENGGEDFDDEYRFWIEKKNNTVDYFAYSYSSGKGGVRFRKAYNRFWKEGIVFQDYINYEVPEGTPLDDIATLFETQKLKVLSRIENTNIKVQPTKH